MRKHLFPYDPIIFQSDNLFIRKTSSRYVAYYFANSHTYWNISKTAVGAMKLLYKNPRIIY